MDLLALIRKATVSLLVGQSVSQSAGHKIWFMSFLYISTQFFAITEKHSSFQSVIPPMYVFIVQWYRFMYVAVDQDTGMWNHIG